MLKAIFWDNDGVLVDTEKLYFQANVETLAGEGIELTRDDFIEISLRQGQSVLAVAGGDVSYQDQLREKRNRRYTELILAEGENILFPGAKEVLNELKDEFYMGIVTSSLKEHFEAIHKSTGILDIFKFVLANGDYERGKPHPDPYLKALEKSGFSKSECVVIEDTERGLGAARAAGIECIMIPHGLTADGNFSEAAYSLGNIKELPDILRNFHA